ncbi:glycosyltransferase, partial [Verrucomicrobia bacterium]|nr:glycosyltransferase [Verrucomicrobiota bacterium]
MEKISVLMNCYNGERYLDEAIQSLFNQTYSNWELVFIDNCSTDNSSKIVEKYGSKIKYYKTTKNVPLGKARKYGVSKCGKYIAILDSDDIWLPNALEELHKAITSGNYALAYGNIYQINKKGVKIGKITNLHAGTSGNFFEKLLYQFDIPIVCTIIDKEKMLECGLNFDEKIHGSEEYCLFVELALTTNFIAIDKYLVQYRTYDSLTAKLNELIYQERFYTLNKIVKKHPQIRSKYRKAFDVAYARGSYYKAQYHV